MQSSTNAAAAPRPASAASQLRAAAHMKAEARAQARLISGPPPLPDAAALAATRKTEKLLAHLHAQDELHATVKWTNELLQPTDVPPVPTVDTALLTRLKDWCSHGENELAKQAAAHQEVVGEVMEGSRTLAADFSRLRKCARRDECDEAVRDRQEAYRDEVILMPMAPAETRKVTHDVTPPSGLASL